MEEIKNTNGQEVETMEKYVFTTGNEKVERINLFAGVQSAIKEYVSSIQDLDTLKLRVMDSIINVNSALLRDYKSFKKLDDSVTKNETYKLYVEEVRNEINNELKKHTFFDVKLTKALFKDIELVLKRSKLVINFRWSNLDSIGAKVELLGVYDKLLTYKEIKETKEIYPSIFNADIYISSKGAKKEPLYTETQLKNLSNEKYLGEFKYNAIKLSKLLKDEIKANKEKIDKYEADKKEAELLAKFELNQLNKLNS